MFSSVYNSEKALPIEKYQFKITASSRGMLKDITRLVIGNDNGDQGVRFYSEPQNFHKTIRFIFNNSVFYIDKKSLEKSQGFTAIQINNELKKDIGKDWEVVIDSQNIERIVKEYLEEYISGKITQDPPEKKPLIDTLLGGWEMLPEYEMDAVYNIAINAYINKAVEGLVRIHPGQPWSFEEDSPNLTSLNTNKFKMLIDALKEGISKDFPNFDLKNFGLSDAAKEAVNSLFDKREKAATETAEYIEEADAKDMKKLNHWRAPKWLSNDEMVKKLIDEGRYKA